MVAGVPSNAWASAVPAMPPKAANPQPISKARFSGRDGADVVILISMATGGW